MRKLLIALALTAGSGQLARAEKTPPAARPAPAPAAKKLYDRLGGKDAITAVVHELVGNIAGDKRINKYFANTDIKHLEQMLVDQVCAVTGGPCKYKGKNMVAAHTGMKLTDADFNALVEDLTKALDKFKVPVPEKTELLKPLAAMKADIVGK